MAEGRIPLGGWLKRVRTGSPLVGLALAVMGGVWLAEGWIFTAAAVLGVAFFVGRAGMAWRVALVGFFLLSAGRGWLIERNGVDVREELGITEAGSRARGTVEVGPLLWPGTASESRLGVFEAENGAKVRVALTGEALEAARRYEVRGWLSLPEEARNPGELSMRIIYEKRGILGELAVEAKAERGWAWSWFWARWAEGARASLRERITMGMDPEGSGREVVQAMVLGETPPRDSELIQAFRHSGSLHVFAVSGLHVTLVGLIAWWGCRLVRMKRRTAVVVIILAMIGYALVTGARPPAMRASLMGTVFLSAFLLRRRPTVLNALGLAVMVGLLWRPSQLFDMGFQLSYGVVAAIIVGVGFFQERTTWMVALDPFMPRSLLSRWQERWLAVRQYVRGLLATSVAAWMGSFPLMWWHFGLVAPVAMLAGVVLIVLTTVILSLALGGAVLGLVFPWGEMVVNRLNEQVGRGAHAAARGFSAVPGGHFYLGKGAPAEIVIFDLERGGAATWVGAGGGVLVDVGNAWSFERVVEPCLRNWQVSPDSVVLTHPDGRHVGGMTVAEEKWELRQALVAVEEARSPAYRAFLEGGLTEIVVGRSGQRYELEPGVWLEVILGGEEGTGWLADDRGMILRLHWHGWRVLFLGDSGLRREAELIESERDFSADLVVMGRHVHGGSGGLEVLQKSGAATVVCSVADFPTHERMPPGWAERVEAAGIRVFRQDVNGAVLVHLEKNEMRVEGFLEDGREVVLRKEDD